MNGEVPLTPDSTKVTGEPQSALVAAGLTVAPLGGTMTVKFACAMTEMSVAALVTFGWRPEVTRLE